MHQRATVCVAAALILTFACIAVAFASGPAPLPLPFQTLPAPTPPSQLPSVPSGIQGMSAVQTPPTAVIQRATSQNALWLLTCPLPPSGDTLEYFDSEPSAFIGGDACVADLPALLTLVSASGQASYDTNVRIGGPETFAADLVSFLSSVLKPPFIQGIAHAVVLSTSLASASVIHFYVGIQPQTSISILGQTIQLPQNILNVVTNRFYLGGAAATLVQDLGYAGEAVLAGQNAISSSYNTKSYIFQQPAASPQKGIWSWTAEYVDLSSVKSSDFTYTLPTQNTNYIEAGLAISTASVDVIVGGPYYADAYTCTYPYSYSYSISQAKMQNTGIPIPSSISLNGNPVTNVATQFNDTFALQYAVPTITSWAAANVFPKLYYNISMPASTSNLNSEVSYLNQSFLLYGPHNILEPNAFLDPYSIDLGAGLLSSNTAGDLIEYPYNAIDMSPGAMNPQTLNSISPLSMFIASAFGNGTAALSSYASQFCGGDASCISQQPQPRRSYPPGVATAVGPCSYAQQQAGSCSKQPVQMGSLIGMYVKNPQYIYSAPNGDVYVINYSTRSGFLGFSPSTTATVFTLRFYPFGQFNPPTPIPLPVGSGYTKLSGVSITPTPKITAPDGTENCKFEVHVTGGSEVRP